MADIVTLDPVLQDDQARVPRRLKALSRVLRLIFTLLLALMGLVLAAAIVICLFFPAYVVMTSGSAGIAMGPGGGPPLALKAGMVQLSDLPFLTHLAGIADIAVMMLPLFLILLHLRGLFGLYAAGTVFARENAAHLRQIGLWLIALPFCRVFANALFQLSGGADAAWFRLSLLQAPILGLIVLAIALVMEFGRDIEQEKDSFI